MPGSPKYGQMIIPHGYISPTGMERSEAMRASIIDKPCQRSTIGFHGRISASNRKTPGKSEFCDLDPASRGRRLQSRKPQAFCVSTRQLVWSRVIGTWRIFQGVNSLTPGKTIKPAFIIDNFLVESALFFGNELQFVKGRMHGIHNTFGVEKPWV